LVDVYCWFLSYTPASWVEGGVSGRWGTVWKCYCAENPERKVFTTGQPRGEAWATKKG